MTITRNQSLARIAEIVSERSTCSRGSVGCIIAYEGRIIATGYNGAASGLPHCDHECICSPDIKPGMIAHCPRHGAEMHCTNTVHAEANAIAFAAKHGVSTSGAELFTTMCPCFACAGLIVNAGIIAVYAKMPYGNERGTGLINSMATKRKKVWLKEWPK